MFYNAGSSTYFSFIAPCAGSRAVE